VFIVGDSSREDRHSTTANADDRQQSGIREERKSSRRPNARVRPQIAVARDGQMMSAFEITKAIPKLR
jgi:hypothetical protein